MQDNQRKQTKEVDHAPVLAAGNVKKRLENEVVNCEPVAVVFITRFSAYENAVSIQNSANEILL